jgi:hypothetical protein
MYCEQCGEKYRWYETVCPACGGTLIPDPPGVKAEPETPIVSIFRTADEGLLPLATLALESAGIEFAVRKVGLSDVFGASHPTPGYSSTGMAVEVYVLEDDAARARDLVVDLEQSAAAGEPSAQLETPAGTAAPEADVPASSPGAPVALIDAESGRTLGSISAAQFDWLSSRLELESSDDDDYYIDGPTLDMLEQDGAGTGLLAALRHALGQRKSVSIRWR